MTGLANAAFAQSRENVFILVCIRVPNKVMSKENFARNLKRLCVQHRSVAHVCRSLQINRQQFNKYLSGTVFPSAHNLARICEFFKLDAKVLELDATAFDAFIKTKSVSGWRTGTTLDAMIDGLSSGSEQLARYLGYYHSHFQAPGYPGYLARSLIRLFRVGNRFYTQSTEHLWDKKKPDNRRHRFHYRGVAFYLADRIFITEVETLTSQSIFHTILYPSYRNRIDSLTGISTGVSSLNTHAPKATRIDYRYLGRDINLKQALKACGLYKHGHPDIDKEIHANIKNDIKADEYMLTARGQ